MKILFLCAGYGTRLQRDLLNSKEYSHLLDIPKALLPLGNEDALLTHWLHLFPKEDVYIVTNAHHHTAFIQWGLKHGIPANHIMSDGTYSNETRLGAVPDILKGIEHFDLTQSDVLVIGGDTLFLHDFDIKAFLDYYHQQDGPTCLVARYTVPDKDVSKMGIMEINKDGIMIGFLEKPSFSHSRFGCPCFYLFPKEALHYLDLFVNLAHSSKESYDATGKFLAYLYPQFKIATFPISGRVDVGGLDSYKEANDLLKKETKTK